MSKSLCFAGMLALTLSAATLPARADSTSGSSASDSITASSVGSSHSFTRSSESSTGDNKKADGNYRVVEVADATEPGATRFTLDAVDGQANTGRYFLDVPADVASKAQLKVGDIVTARTRDYGLEFSDAARHEAFFLVLHDDWYRDLKANAVSI